MNSRFYRADVLPGGPGALSALAAQLRAAGYDAVHARDRGLAEALDDVIMDVARAEGRIIVTADTDFGAILAVGSLHGPSVVAFRHGAPRRPDHQAAMLMANLDTLADDLTAGALVTIRRDRVRIRRLG